MNLEHAEQAPPFGAPQGQKQPGPPLRVSIIIPHLNEPEALRRCLAALEAQRGEAPAFEIIVADNGSTQTPEAICAEFTAVTLVNEPQPGPGPARNLGASVARGDILAFIDADCFAEPGWISTLAHYFDSHEEVGFIAGGIGIAPAEPGRMNGIEAYEAIFSYRVKLFVERDRFAATGNMAVRASVFDAVGPFDGIAQHEDKLWGQKACAQGHALAYVPQARVLTPACAGPKALAVRIERHVAHDFGAKGPGWRASARWLMRSLLMPVSPLLGLGEILRSAEIRAPGLRLKAFICLTQTRFHRAACMLDLLRRDWSGEQLSSWNRPAQQAQAAPIPSESDNT